MTECEEYAPWNGAYRSAREWLATTGLNPHDWVKQVPIGGQQPIALAPPIGLEQPLHWRLEQMGGVFGANNEQTVTIVPEGQVCGLYADIVTPDGKLILGYGRQTTDSGGLPESPWSSGRPPLQRTDDTVAVIADKTSGAYFHWLLDVLPRIHILRQCGIEPDRYVIYGKRNADFQYAALAALGIPERKVVTSGPQLFMQARRLVTPKLTRKLRPRWVYEFLRRDLMTARGIVPLPTKKRLYISRANTGKRRVLNEAELLPVLKRFGFDVVTPEHLPLDRQIELFASAEVIAGPHGSGLTNMVFSPPGTTVVELFSPLFVHTFFPILSGALGHRHYYEVGEGERPPAGVVPANGRPDMTISPKRLERLLRLAGL
ncbi:DUF563 domain-containing protein [Paenibacillus hodogayensis]|uniref:DUF563 domain-containing protein n=1 Tax=Paenibacillus hodogayensis TaxID=279208 RepID=A0ABV5VT37_9BACL